MMWPSRVISTRSPTRNAPLSWSSVCVVPSSILIVSRYALRVITLPVELPAEADGCTCTSETPCTTPFPGWKVAVAAGTATPGDAPAATTGPATGAAALGATGVVTTVGATGVATTVPAG